ncbi:MAG: DegV family protein [Candidatus Neomarinimicrobiota bacterium]
MAIEYLDGIRLYRVLSAGLQRIKVREDHLNRINVFPVPDADTGTNMVYTLTSIQEGINQQVHSNVYDMSVAIADSALDGARGNAGSILAQFLVGLSEGFHNKAKLTTKQFAAATEVGTQFAYQAMMKPVEGTILTVIQDWSDATKSLSESITDFTVLIQESLKKAQKSLQDTPKKLKVLAKAGVVDAGGQGFVDLLEGIQEYIQNGFLSQIKSSEISRKIPEKIEFNEKYRYCTECVISGENINRIKLQEGLMDLGDSFILAGSKHKAKVHIHTDNPKLIMEICSEFGQISRDKADDMLLQQKYAHLKHKKIALVVDSTADLPEEIIDSGNIHIVPVRLSFGDKHYIDKTTMTIDEFWHELEINPNHPKTSQPTPGDFRRQYQFLSTHYDSAISIHLPPTVSGTYQSAISAAQGLTNFPIKIVDANNVSIATGLITIRASEAVELDKSFDETVKIINEAIQNTKIYILLDSLEFLVRGGRIPKSKKRIADVLRAHPVLSLNNEGKIDSIGKIFGHKNTDEKFLEFVSKRIPHGVEYRVGITHGGCEDRAKKIAEHFTALIGKENVFFSQLGPGLGTHAGPGVIAVAIQSLEDSLHG